MENISITATPFSSILKTQFNFLVYLCRLGALMISVIFFLYLQCTLRLNVEIIYHVTSSGRKLYMRSMSGYTDISSCTISLYIFTVALVERWEATKTSVTVIRPFIILSRKSHSRPRETQDSVIYSNVGKREALLGLFKKVPLFGVLSPSTFRFC